MKIEKAIGILRDMEWDLTNPHFPDNITAVKLGIEALELLLRLRAKGWSHPTDPLPGETKD